MTISTLLDARSRGKIKERASPAEGNGGGSGIVLSMDMVSTSYYAVYVQVNILFFPLLYEDNTWYLPRPLIHRAYTVPVQVGSPQQSLSLQVDTGSSDLVRHVILCTHTLLKPSFPVDCIQIVLISLMLSNKWASI